MITKYANKTSWTKFKKLKNIIGQKNIKILNNWVLFSIRSRFFIKLKYIWLITNKKIKKLKKYEKLNNLNKNISKWPEIDNK